MIRILYVTPVAERGGAEVYLLNLLRFHDRSRFEPAICLLKDGPLVDEVRPLADGGTWVFPTTRLRSLSSFSAVRGIRRVLKRSSIDIVFGNMAMGHAYGGTAALGTSTRAVWFEYGVLGELDFVGRMAARLPAEVTFAASTFASSGRVRLNRRTPVHVVPSGIDVDKYDPGRYSRGSVRRELGIDPGAPIIACVARLQRWKGQSLFLQAAQTIHRRCPTAQFLVVGGTLFGLDADYGAQLRREAAALLPSGTVHFLGNRDDVASVLADVDVFVHCPIRPEPFGLVVPEAMSMALGVVSVTGSGPEEILTEDTGILVPPQDASSLAGAVLSLIEDPARRRLMGEAAHRRVQEKFSARTMVRDIETVLQTVIGRT